MNREFLADIKIPKIDNSIKQLKIAMCVLKFNVGTKNYTKTV